MTYTDYAARAAARAERRMVEVYERVIELNDNESISVSFDRGDPDYAAMIDGMHAVAGSQFDPGAEREGGYGVWNAEISRGLAEFALRWEFPVRGRAAKLLKATLVQPAAISYVVRLAPVAGRVVISYTPDLAHLVHEAHALPGFDNGQVDLGAPVIDFAHRHGLRVDPAVEQAFIELVQADPIPALLAQASGCGSPEDLSPEFIQLAIEAL